MPFESNLRENQIAKEIAELWRSNASAMELINKMSKIIEQLEQRITELEK